MRLLLCHNFYANEGGENTVFRQAAAILTEHGEDVRLFTRDSATIASSSRFERLAMVRNGLHSAHVADELSALVDEFRPQAALVQNVFPLLSPAVYTTLHARGVPIVQLVFNYRFLCVNAQLFVRRQVCERCVGGRFGSALLRRCLHGSLPRSAWYAAILGWHRRARTFERTIARYVVPHDFVGRKLVEGGFPADRIRVNPNPFVLPEPCWTEAAIPYVAYLGRVVPEKGVLVLVEAFERLPPPLRLAIVGDGEDLSRVRTYLATRPALASRVDLHGPLWGDAGRAVLAGAQVVVLPSEWHDVSPLLIYNAMALGKPVVASDRGSQPEIVQDGVCGRVFVAGDAADLAAKLGALCADPAARARMGRAGRVRAEALFTPEHHYRRLRQVLDEVVAAAS